MLGLSGGAGIPDLGSPPQLQLDVLHDDGQTDDLMKNSGSDLT